MNAECEIAETCLPPVALPKARQTNLLPKTGGGTRARRRREAVEAVLSLVQEPGGERRRAGVAHVVPAQAPAQAEEGYEGHEPPRRGGGSF